MSGGAVFEWSRISEAHIRIRCLQQIPINVPVNPGQLNPSTNYICTVLPRHAKHRAIRQVAGGSSPGETVVADLEDTVGVDQQVSRLDVPVDDFGRVEVLHTTQNLVQENLQTAKKTVGNVKLKNT
jgi:hypothetical protein